jgi:hypothetical protein
MSDFRDLVHHPKHKRRFERLLRLAAQRGDAEQVAERLSWGINPNATTKRGRTAMMVNIRSASPSAGVVKALLDAKADPTLLDLNGLTALDYANRKLAKLNMRPRKPPPKSRSLDENDQLILAPYELEMFDEVRRDHPDSAREYINSYMKERLKAARKVFNDPAEVEKIVELLTAAAQNGGEPKPPA